ncbi:MAG: Tetratricopeptide repeat protein [Labilithrix sp.]|nr:Tetratricopeptide repeat protein [Labilithrix sp.]
MNRPRSFRAHALGTLLVMLHALLVTSLPSAALAQTKKPAPAAQPQDLIARGQSLFDDQQYEESIQTLSGALLKPNNTQAQRVEIYRLLALNYITLGRKDEAENAVRGLLVQQPDYEIPAKESPRFRDFFAQARAKWEAEGRPGIVKEVEIAKPVVLRHGSPAQVDANTSLELRGRLEDPEGRTGSVKLYYRVGTKGDFTESKATVDGDAVRATLPASVVKPPVIDYYFEVLDGAGAVIASRGDASSPLRIAVPESSGKGWVLPVAIGGGVLGAAAIVGVLALAGVFKASSSGGGGRPTSTVSISVGDASRGF